MNIAYIGNESDFSKEILKSIVKNKKIIRINYIPSYLYKWSI